MIDKPNSYSNRLIFFAVLLLALLYRSILAYTVFGGGDATNTQSFFLLERANVSLYELDSPWPYLPMTVGLLHIAGYLSEIFPLDAQHHYRFLITLVDLSLACLIYTVVNKNGKNKLSSMIAFSMYAFNPVSSMITSILAFLDATALLVMFLIAIRIKNDVSQHQSIEITKNSFLLAIAVSFKPMAIILLPYLVYRSVKPHLLLIFFIVFIHICNLNFIIEMGFSKFYELIGYILIKMTVGHQLSGIGLGAFENYISFTNLKLITIAGLLFSTVIMLHALRADPYTYVSLTFLSLLAFRYNTHPQYLLWPLPFLILARGSTITLWYSLVSAFTIIMALPPWHSNSSAYVLMEIFGFSSSGKIDQLLKSAYDESILQYSLQFLLISCIIFSIRLTVIKTASLQISMYTVNLMKSINPYLLIGYTSIFLPILLLNRSYIFMDDILFSLKFIILSIAPVFLVIILLSIRLPTVFIKLYQGMFFTFTALQVLMTMNIVDIEILRWFGSLFYIVLLIELRRITDYLLPSERDFTWSSNS